MVAEGLERRLALAAGDLDPTFGGDGIVVSDFPTPVTTGVTAALGVGSVVLAPSIVAGYAVRAADREEREDQGRRSG